MSRYAPPNVTSSFGPGPWTPAVRVIILTNIAVFVVAFFFGPWVVGIGGLYPAGVLRHGWLWQPVTYMFVHEDPLHILFNMLMVWMFGVDLERRWGSVAFTKYYLLTGVGAGVATLVISVLPFDAARAVYGSTTIGASGAVYGLLLAWAVVFPTRQLLLFMLVPVEARYAALIYGAVAFFMGVAGNGRVAEFAHLGGLVTGWLYLKGPRGVSDELRYRLSKWRMARVRRRFEVKRGGKSGRIH